MKIEIWAIEKTKEPWIIEGEKVYLNRLQHYVPVDLIHLPGTRSSGKLQEEEQKTEEAKRVLAKLEKRNALLFILDEKGNSYSSEKFAGFLQKTFNRGAKEVIFLIGGPYGIARELLDKADSLISLSPMTFTHQMARIFILEQLYRAMTILRNESYHH